MPAETERQRRLFCIALSIKRGETEASFSEQAAKIARENSEETLAEFCGSVVKEPKTFGAATSAEVENGGE